MKILAIEKEIGGVDWSNRDEILKQEALQVYELQKQGVDSGKSSQRTMRNYRTCS